MAKLNSYKHHGSHQHSPCSKQTPQLHFRKKKTKANYKNEVQESHFTVHSLSFLLSHNPHKLLQATTVGQYSSGPTVAHHFNRCTDDRICLLLHQRLLHFTSIGSTLSVATDETREAIDETICRLIHRPPLDPRKTIHSCSNETETEIHQVLQGRNFFNSILVYIFFMAVTGNELK